jgi:hypothetical protein
MEIPRPLRAWLVAHGAFHLATGLPLLVAPGLVLPRLGWTDVGPILPRIIGACAVAIGATSLRARDAAPEVVRARVRLNLVWSFTAAAALFVYIGAGAPPATWAFLSALIVLTGVWFNQAVRFRQLDRAPALDETAGPEDEPELPEDTND